MRKVVKNENTVCMHDASDDKIYVAIEANETGKTINTNTYPEVFILRQFEDRWCWVPLKVNCYHIDLGDFGEFNNILKNLVCSDCYEVYEFNTVLEMFREITELIEEREIKLG